MTPALKLLIIAVVGLTDLAVGAFLTWRLLLQGRTAQAVLVAGVFTVATIASLVLLFVFL